MEEVYNEFEDPVFTEELSEELAPESNEVKPERKARTIEIGNDVVETVAGIAASQTPGVAKMAGGGATFAEILSRKNVSKGARVDIKEGNADIDVFIIASQGTNLGQLFRDLQKNVKGAVENMTGLVVNAVNVYTQGIAEDEEVFAAEE